MEKEVLTKQNVFGAFGLFGRIISPPSMTFLLKNDRAEQSTLNWNV